MRNLAKTTLIKRQERGSRQTSVWEVLEGREPIESVMYWSELQGMHIQRMVVFVQENKEVQVGGTYVRSGGRVFGLASDSAKVATMSRKQRVVVNDGIYKVDQQATAINSWPTTKP